MVWQISGDAYLLVVNAEVRLGPQQISEAVGGSNTQPLPHWTVLLLAQVRLGGVVSTTVTTCVQTLTPPPQQLLACQTCEIALGQPGPPRRLVELLSKVKAKLVQHRSMKGGGLVGMGLPHSTTVPAAVEHSSVGGEGTKLINCVQVVLLPQQSTAFQNREIPPLQPGLVELPRRTTCTALQHGDKTAGFNGGTGSGPPQATVMFVHNKTGGPGRIVTC